MKTRKEQSAGEGGKIRGAVREKERVIAMRVLQVGRRRSLLPGVQTQGQVADWGPLAGERGRGSLEKRRGRRDREHGNLTFGRGQHP